MGTKQGGPRSSLDRLEPRSLLRVRARRAAVARPSNQLPREVWASARFL